MAKLTVIKLDQSKAEPLEVSDMLAEAAFNPFLIKDAVVYQQAKSRAGNHATKSRGFIIGSRRKLYRQKGTGSARPGDRKAPHRRGGGVAHGPHRRDHSISLNKKVRKAALRSALAEKIRRQQLTLLDGIALESHKTKALRELLEKLGAPKALIVTEEIDRNLELASRNLPTVEVIHPSQCNVYNLLRYEKVLMTRQALSSIQERLIR
ncbi:MAG: 50S ribosomal protein L4 [SAR324 cluster bacterium]|nr:50S ribosomal protein L4 [SAR324 cluster bacterium]MCZ6532521.1 50S ribosomal protein L4 [SAR324 cluster bacterium]MCZ6646373.1 50S ribosomal protein L4 [SAR324 cluster bacterium]MCZ6844069.1 50S ribosomal protein L4 [SAR324 cluster bacterium]